MKRTPKMWRQAFVALLSISLVTASPGIMAFAESSLSGTKDAATEQPSYEGEAATHIPAAVPSDSTDEPSQDESPSENAQDTEAADSPEDQQVDEGLVDDSPTSDDEQQTLAEDETTSIEEVLTDEETTSDDTPSDDESVTVEDALATQAGTKEFDVSWWSELRNALYSAEYYDSVTIKLGSDITISGEGTSAVIHSNTNVTLDLNGHTLRYSGADQTIYDCYVITIKQNASLTLRDTSSAQTGTITGGTCGIANFGSLTMMDGIIKDNKEIRTSSSRTRRGAGISNYGTALITGGTITNNKVTNGNGGGIYNSGDLTITSCKITNNSVENGDGGGIYCTENKERTYYAEDTKLSIEGVTLSDNSAQYGGGIFLGKKVKAEILGGTITNNVAQVNGGGINLDKDATLEIFDGSITGNAAHDSGGGIYSGGYTAIAKCTITGNSCGQKGVGGGIAVFGSLELNGAVVVENNTCDKLDSDVFLNEDKAIIVSGKFGRRARVGISSHTESTTLITNGYEKSGNTADVTRIFFANPNDAGDDVRIVEKDGEACYVIAVHYLDADGNDQVCLDYSVFKANTETLAVGWYVVRPTDETVLMNNHRLEVTGDANLILCDHANVTLNKGIHLAKGSLNVWGQSLCADYGLPPQNPMDVQESVGQLIAVDIEGAGNAGIGTNKDENADVWFTLNSGKVYATSTGGGAGVGGGQGSSGSGFISVYGGMLKAVGSGGGAGVGGGLNSIGRNLIVDGGTVLAYGSRGAAAIGSGEGVQQHTSLVISSGKVYAEADKTTSSDAVGVGAGSGGALGGYIRVENGGALYAVGVNAGPGIGATGKGAIGCTIKIQEGATVTALGGNSTDVAIGITKSDDNEMGLLTCEGAVRAYAGSSKDSATPVELGTLDGSIYSGRDTAGQKNRYVLYTTCDHSDATATYEDVDANTHLRFRGACQWCGDTGGQGESVTEAHSFDTETHTCVCGHKEYAVNLTKDNPLDLPYILQTTYVSDGGTYVLPQYTWEYPPTSGIGDIKAFLGWECDGKVYQIGESVTITKETWISARWYNPLIGWEDPVYEWREDNSTCTGLRKNTLYDWLSESRTVDTTIQVIEGNEPTCEETGAGFYVASFFIPFSTQVKYGAVIPALGHDWGEPTYTWSEDNSQVTATVTCKRDSSHKLTETVDTTQEVVKEAACESDGELRISAEFENDLFEDQEKYFPIDALGHKWGEPTYTWSEDHATCTATRVCERDASHVETETVETTSVVTQGASCEKPEITTYTATFTNEAFEEQVEEVETKEALGHVADDPVNENVVAATCEKAGSHDVVTYCTRCNIELSREHVVDPALGHDWGDWIVSILPTEESKGEKYRVCKRDESHVERVAIPELAHTHNMKSVAEVSPGCVTSGVAAHWRCTKCDLLYADEAGEQQVTIGEIRIPATGHKKGEVKRSNEQAPTCTEAGHHVETTYCSVCHAKLSTEFIIDGPLGHDWGTPTYKWSDDNSTVTATHVCNRDPNHNESKTVETTLEVTKAPTCESPGTGIYTATFETEGFTTQTKEAAIPALGHDWGKPSYVWTKNYTVCTATRICKTDSSHVEIETVQTGAEVTQAASCNDPEMTTYTATFENEAFATQTKEIKTGNALGHDWGKATYYWSSDSTTCTATHTCKRDANHTETETVETTSEVTQKAGCENPEITTYTATFKNESFGTYTRDIQTADALGHDWGTPTYSWSADNTSCTATRICRHDASHVETETVETTSEITQKASCENPEITTYTATFTNEAFGEQTAEAKTADALGHTPGNPVDENVIAATCEGTGSHDVVTRCTICGKELSSEHVIDPALGHDWDDWVVIKEPTEKSEGLRERVCRRDGSHKQTEIIPALGHTHAMEYVDEVEADCTTSGTKAHWRCTKCGLLYLDEAGEQQVSLSDLRTPAKGHQPGEPVVSDEVEPTCEKAGHHRETVRCTACGRVLSVEYVVDDPLGHDWGEPTYVWSSDNMTCTATHVCKRDASHVETETVRATTKVTQEANCEDPELTAFTATFTNESFQAQTKEAKTADALGHTAGDPVNENVVAPTCEEAGSHDVVTRCVRCGIELSRELVVDPALGHDWGDWVITKEPTEDLDGERERVCRRDGSHKQTEVIPAFGHTHAMEYVDEVEAGCTTSGTKAHWHCTKCGLLYRDEAGLIKTTLESLRIPAKGHQPGEPVVSNEVEPTCEIAGHHLETVRCSVCDKVLSVHYVTDPALGHDWDEPTYAWSSDNTTCTATRACKRDASHIETETVRATTKVTQEATCENVGTAVLTAEFKTDAFGTQTKEVELPSRGHDWGDPTYSWSDDGSTCTATRLCRHDASHVETETSSATSVVMRPATCEDGGIVSHTVTFKNTAFGAQSKEFEIPALGHDWGEPTYVWSDDNSTCTALRTCKNDTSHVEAETVAASWVETQAPTASKPGERVYTATFENPAFAEQTKTVTLPPTGGEDISYRLTSGSGANWTKGSTEGLAFTFERSLDEAETFDHFTGVVVDGQTIAATQYEAHSGSVVVTLLPSYLETLSVGGHTLRAAFDDGDCEQASFTVEEADDGNPTDEDGDSTDKGSGNDKGSRDPSVPHTDDPFFETDKLVLAAIVLALALIAFGLAANRHKEERLP